MSVQDLGDNVRRLMKIRKLTIPELAGTMERGTATLSNLLNGKSEPRSSTLIKLSRALNVSFDELLSDTPRLKSLRFRTSKTLSGREKAERDQIRHDTALWLHNYRFLEESLGQVKPFLLESPSVNDPEKAAMAVRKLVGSGDDCPVFDITELIENAGIKLRIKDFRFSKTFGLSIGFGDGGPAIVVNSATGISVERQIFTMAHELGHLILHKESYRGDQTDESEEEEKEADRFAGAFLMPENLFRREWDDCRGLHWVDAVLRVKKYFKVSFKTVLHRLEMIRESSSSRSIFMDFAISYKNLYGHDLKDHYEPDPLSPGELVEERYARLVRDAYDGELISMGRAAELLGISLMAMRERMRDWRKE
jgi:Zn-dependent peptidase ImmA (M78 family)